MTCAMRIVYMLILFVNNAICNLQEVFQDQHANAISPCEFLCHVLGTVKKDMNIPLSSNSPKLKNKILDAVDNLVKVIKENKGVNAGHPSDYRITKDLYEALDIFLQLTGVHIERNPNMNKLYDTYLEEDIENTIQSELISILSANPDGLISIAESENLDLEEFESLSYYEDPSYFVKKRSHAVADDINDIFALTCGNNFQKDIFNSITQISDAIYMSHVYEILLWQKLDYIIEIVLEIANNPSQLDASRLYKAIENLILIGKNSRNDNQRDYSKKIQNAMKYVHIYLSKLVEYPVDGYLNDRMFTHFQDLLNCILRATYSPPGEDFNGILMTIFNAIITDFHKMIAYPVEKERLEDLLKTAKYLSSVISNLLRNGENLFNKSLERIIYAFEHICNDIPLKLRSEMRKSLNNIFYVMKENTLCSDNDSTMESFIIEIRNLIQILRQISEKPLDENLLIDSLRSMNFAMKQSHCDNLQHKHFKSLVINPTTYSVPNNVEKNNPYTSPQMPIGIDPYYRPMSEIPHADEPINDLYHFINIQQFDIDQNPILPDQIPIILKEDYNNALTKSMVIQQLLPIENPFISPEKPTQLSEYILGNNKYVIPSPIIRNPNGYEQVTEIYDSNFPSWPLINLESQVITSNNYYKFTSPFRIDDEMSSPLQEISYKINQPYDTFRDYHHIEKTYKPLTLLEILQPKALYVKKNYNEAYLSPSQEKQTVFANQPIYNLNQFVQHSGYPSHLIDTDHYDIYDSFRESELENKQIPHTEPNYHNQPPDIYHQKQIPEAAREQHKPPFKVQLIDDSLEIQDEIPNEKSDYSSPDSYIDEPSISNIEEHHIEPVPHNIEKLPLELLTELDSSQYYTSDETTLAQNKPRVSQTTNNIEDQILHETSRSSIIQEQQINYLSPKSTEHYSTEENKTLPLVSEPEINLPYPFEEDISKSVKQNDHSVTSIIEEEELIQPHGFSIEGDDIEPFPHDIENLPLEPLDNLKNSQYYTSYKSALPQNKPNDLVEKTSINIADQILHETSKPLIIQEQQANYLSPEPTEHFTYSSEENKPFHLVSEPEVNLPHPLEEDVSQSVKQNDHSVTSIIEEEELIQPHGFSIEEDDIEPFPHDIENLPLEPLDNLNNSQYYTSYKSALPQNKPNDLVEKTSINIADQIFHETSKPLIIQEQQANYLSPEPTEHFTYSSEENKPFHLVYEPEVNLPYPFEEDVSQSVKQNDHSVTSITEEEELIQPHGFSIEGDDIEPFPHDIEYLPLEPLDNLNNSQYYTSYKSALPQNKPNDLVEKTSINIADQILHETSKPLIIQEQQANYLSPEPTEHFTYSSEENKTLHLVSEPEVNLPYPLEEDISQSVKQNDHSVTSIIEEEELIQPHGFSIEGDDIEPFPHDIENLPLEPLDNLKNSQYYTSYKSALRQNKPNDLVEKTSINIADQILHETSIPLMIQGQQTNYLSPKSTEHFRYSSEQNKPYHPVSESEVNWHNPFEEVIPQTVKQNDHGSNIEVEEYEVNLSYPFVETGSQSVKQNDHLVTYIIEEEELIQPSYPLDEFNELEPKYVDKGDDIFQNNTLIEGQIAQEPLNPVVIDASDEIEPYPLIDSDSNYALEETILQPQIPNKPLAPYIIEVEQPVHTLTPINEVVEPMFEVLDHHKSHLSQESQQYPNQNIEHHMYHQPLQSNKIQERKSTYTTAVYLENIAYSHEEFIPSKQQATYIKNENSGQGVFPYKQDIESELEHLVDQSDYSSSQSQSQNYPNEHISDQLSPEVFDLVTIEKSQTIYISPNNSDDIITSSNPLKEPELNQQYSIEELVIKEVPPQMKPENQGKIVLAGESVPDYISDEYVEYNIPDHYVPLKSLNSYNVHNDNTDPIVIIPQQHTIYPTEEHEPYIETHSYIPEDKYGIFPMEYTVEDQRFEQISFDPFTTVRTPIDSSEATIKIPTQKQIDSPYPQNKYAVQPNIIRQEPYIDNSTPELDQGQTFYHNTGTVHQQEQIMDEFKDNLSVNQIDNLVPALPLSHHDQFVSDLPDEKEEQSVIEPKHDLRYLSEDNILQSEPPKIYFNEGVQFLQPIQPYKNNHKHIVHTMSESQNYQSEEKSSHQTEIIIQELVQDPAILHPLQKSVEFDEPKASYTFDNYNKPLVSTEFHIDYSSEQILQHHKPIDDREEVSSTSVELVLQSNQNLDKPVTNHIIVPYSNSKFPIDRTYFVTQPEVLEIHKNPEDNADQIIQYPIGNVRSEPYPLPETHEDNSQDLLLTEYLEEPYSEEEHMSQVSLNSDQDPDFTIDDIPQTFADEEEPLQEKYQGDTIFYTSSQVKPQFESIPEQEYQPNKVDKNYVQSQIHESVPSDNKETEIDTISDIGTDHNQSNNFYLSSELISRPDEPYLEKYSEQDDYVHPFGKILDEKYTKIEPTVTPDKEDQVRYTPSKINEINQPVLAYGHSDDDEILEPSIIFEEKLRELSPESYEDHLTPLSSQSIDKLPIVLSTESLEEMNTNSVKKIPEPKIIGQTFAPVIEDIDEEPISISYIFQDFNYDDKKDTEPYLIQPNLNRSEYVIDKIRDGNDEILKGYLPENSEKYIKYSNTDTSLYNLPLTLPENQRPDISEQSNVPQIISVTEIKPIKIGLAVESYEDPSLVQGKHDRYTINKFTSKETEEIVSTPVLDNYNQYNSDEIIEVHQNELLREYSDPYSVQQQPNTNGYVTQNFIMKGEPSTYLEPEQYVHYIYDDYVELNPDQPPTNPQTDSLTAVVHNPTLYYYDDYTVDTNTNLEKYIVNHAQTYGKNNVIHVNEPQQIQFDRETYGSDGYLEIPHEHLSKKLPQISETSLNEEKLVDQHELVIDQHFIGGQYSAPLGSDATENHYIINYNTGTEKQLGHKYSNQIMTTSDLIQRTAQALEKIFINENNQGTVIRLSKSLENLFNALSYENLEVEKANGQIAYATDYLLNSLNGEYDDSDKEYMYSKLYKSVIDLVNYIIFDVRGSPTILTPSESSSIILNFVNVIQKILGIPPDTDLSHDLKQSLDLLISALKESFLNQKTEPLCYEHSDIIEHLVRLLNEMSGKTLDSIQVLRSLNILLSAIETSLGTTQDLISETSNDLANLLSKITRRRLSNEMGSRLEETIDEFAYFIGENIVCAKTEIGRAEIFPFINEICDIWEDILEHPIEVILRMHLSSLLEAWIYSLRSSTCNEISPLIEYMGYCDQSTSYEIDNVDNIDEKITNKVENILKGIQKVTIQNIKGPLTTRLPFLLGILFSAIREKSISSEAKVPYSVSNLLKSLENTKISNKDVSSQLYHATEHLVRTVKNVNIKTRLKRLYIRQAIKGLVKAIKNTVGYSRKFHSHINLSSSIENFIWTIVESINSRNKENLDRTLLDSFENIANNIRKIIGDRVSRERRFEILFAIRILFNALVENLTAIKFQTNTFLFSGLHEDLVNIIHDLISSIEDENIYKSLFALIEWIINNLKEGLQCKNIKPYTKSFSTGIAEFVNLLQKLSVGHEGISFGNQYNTFDTLWFEMRELACKRVVYAEDSNIIEQGFKEIDYFSSDHRTELSKIVQRIVSTIKRYVSTKYWKRINIFIEILETFLMDFIRNIALPFDEYQMQQNILIGRTIDEFSNNLDSPIKQFSKYKLSRTLGHLGLSIKKTLRKENLIDHIVNILTRIVLQPNEDHLKSALYIYFMKYFHNLEERREFFNNDLLNLITFIHLNIIESLDASTSHTTPADINIIKQYDNHMKLEDSLENLKVIIERSTGNTMSSDTTELLSEILHDIFAAIEEINVNISNTFLTHQENEHLSTDNLIAVTEEIIGVPIRTHDAVTLSNTIYEFIDFVKKIYEQKLDTVTTEDTANIVNKYYQVPDLLDDSQQENGVFINNGDSLILFTKICNGCKRAEHQFKKFKESSPQKQIHKTIVDCEQQRKFCRQRDIGSFPAVLWYHNQEKVQQYQGEITENNLQRFENGMFTYRRHIW